MKTTFTSLFLLCVYFCYSQIDEQIEYPVAPHSTSTDTIWNVVVKDPYRNLEKDDDELKQWLKAEKQITDDYFKKANRKYDLDFVRQHSYRYNLPSRSGPYYIEAGYALGGMNVYYKDYLRDRPNFLYNTSMLSSKATSFSDIKFSQNGKYCAFAYSNEDNDWEEIRILNTTNMLLLKEHIYNVRYSNIAWFQTGFYYSRFDSVNENHKHTEVQTNQRLYYHKIDTDPSFDTLVFEDKDYPYNTFSVKVTDDERFAIMQEYFPEDNKTVTFLKDSKSDSGFRVLFAERGAKVSIIGSIGDTLLAISKNKDAFNGQIVEIDTKKPLKWGVVVDNQQKYLIKSALYVNDKYCVIFQEGFREYLCVFSRSGDILKTIPLSEGSSNHLICYSPDQNSIIVSKNYYIHPPIGELFSLKDYSLNVINKTLLDFNPSSYKFYLTNYMSRDSTLVPIYIVMSNDYIKKGPGAALLSVYGGFGISPEARFNPGIFTFLNNGGIYAVANVRGGSNSTKNWHELGSGINKQNTIDDAYYAARFLVDSGFALSGKIAITGGSNGGMIVAATINQHPGIFKAAVLNVGVYDMLRYENFTAGVFWNSEYGSINDSAQFNALRSYSPLHNIKPNTNYPSMLISTSEYDDRVPPLHSYKYVAALQELTKSKNPILMNVNKKEGHTAINDKLFFSFLFKELNMKYDPFSYYKDK